MSSLRNNQVQVDCAKAVSKFTDDCVTVRSQMLKFASKVALIDNFASSTDVNGDWKAIRTAFDDVIHSLDVNCTKLSTEISTYLSLLPNAAKPDWGEDMRTELAGSIDSLRPYFTEFDKAREFEDIATKVDGVLQAGSKAVTSTINKLEADRQDASESLQAAQANLQRIKKLADEKRADSEKSYLNKGVNSFKRLTGSEARTEDDKDDKKFDLVETAGQLQDALNTKADENPDLDAATKALAEAQSWKLEVDAKVAKAKSIDWPGCASTLGQIKIGLENLGKGQSSFGQSCIIYNDELTGYKKAFDDMAASNVPDNQLALQAWHQKARDDEKEFVSLVKSLNNYSYKLK